MGHKVLFAFGLCIFAGAYFFVFLAQHTSQPVQAQATSTYYVDGVNGSDSNDGLSQANAWKTIGKANEGHSGGDTVNFLPAEYRESIYPKSGTADHYTQYVGLGDREDIKILGSDEVAGWTQYSGNIYYATFRNDYRQRCPGVSDTDCWEDRQVWLDPESSIGALDGPSEVFYDHDSSRVYVWTSDGQPPSSHTIECSSRATGPWHDEFTPYWPDSYSGNTSYVSVSNLTIMQSYDDGICMDGDNDCITINNNDFAYNSGGGSCASNPSAIIHHKHNESPKLGIRITNNVIRYQGDDRGAPLDSGHGGAGIKFYSTGDAVIEGNTIYNIGQGIEIKSGIFNDNLSIKNNTIHDFINGITFVITGTNSIVEGNVLYAGSGNSIWVDGPTDNIDFVHNVISDAPKGFVCTSESGILTNHLLQNNIFSNIRTDLLIRNDGYSITLDNSDYNLYDEAIFNWFGSTYYSPADFNNATGFEYNSQADDLLFTDPANGDFTLQAASPARDQGTLIEGYHCPLSYDVDPNQSNCRQWNGTAPDIGAFEYGLVIAESEDDDTTDTTDTTNGTDATDNGAQPVISVASGTSFFAYDKSLRGGYQIDAGNVLGDTREEIISGTGDGMAPHVRVFDESGALQSQFFAYDSSLRNGVTVTACELTGDWRDEIVTVQGHGDWPIVRIFDA